MIKRMMTLAMMLKMTTVICNFDSRAHAYKEQISCCENFEQGICSLRLLYFLKKFVLPMFKKQSS